MDTVITEYQKWKKHGEQLRTQAKNAMEDRFRELLSEAVQIAQEYHVDFGTALKPPPNVSAFKFKTVAGKKLGKGVKAPAAKPVAAATPRVSAANPAIVGLQKKRAQLQKKLDEAKAAAKPTKNLEDRIYEVDDELRLAGGAA